MSLTIAEHPVDPRPGPVRGSDSHNGRAEDIGRLVVSCPDRPGIVSAITTFLYDRGANIVQFDQDSTDPRGGRFFQRLVFHLPGLGDALPRLEREFATEVARPSR
jgi:formyltetrahydrofolate deformylase